MVARHILSLALFSAAAVLAAPGDPPPLTSKKYAYNQIPYRVSPEAIGRGPQSGYNICNSTTEGPTSQCQTALVNSIDDFCLWSGTKPNELVGDIEAATVAWCSKAGHGTRLMPAGTLTGVQFLRAPHYLQVTGTINQANIDLAPDDDGGELDPHGADQQGNPLGGLVYTNGFASNHGANASFQQVIEWHNFMGSNVFCFKICDPAVAGSKPYCNNVYDRTGCQFVAPADYAVGQFLSCDSDDQDPPGVYTGTDGKVSTWHQGPEGVAVSTPYTPQAPKTSNCVSFTSSVLYAGAPAASVSSSSSTTSSSIATSTGSVSSSGSGSGTGIVTSKPPSATGTSSRAASPSSSAAGGSAARVAGPGAAGFVAAAVAVIGGLGALVVAL